MPRYAVLALMALVCAPYAHAQEAPNKLLPADVTVLTLDDSASRKVSQDRIQSSLRLEERGGDPVTLQSRINDRMKKALNLARRYSTVDVSTGGYNIYRINGRDEPNQWQASQSIQLDSGDAGTLLNLTGELQKAGFLSGGMQFYLSREKSASLTDDLLEEALSKLIARAKRIGATLGKQSVQVAEVSHGEGGGRPPMYMNKSMMGGERMSMSAAPVAEGTDQEVQVSVHAVVYLRP